MENNVNFKDEEMKKVIHKSMEIYETIKNCIIKIESRRLNDEDKKYLALLLGILNTDNEVEKILKMLKWEYGISVIPTLKSSEECDEIWKNSFSQLFNKNNITEDKIVSFLMLILLDKKAIKDLHCSLGLSTMCIKLILCNIVKENEEKGLQKSKTMIL